MARGRGKRGAGPDLVRLDVFHHLFAAAAEEMGATLQRSSFSPNIRERRDFSCALFDAGGRMIGQASHLPVHLGSTPMSVEAAIAHVDMAPGDAVVLNDPYAGGTHLPDLTLVSPVFLPGGKRPAFYCANRAHHADVGGAQPGSMAPAPDVHGEGLRIPPVRLVRGGEVERDVLALLLANMRVPDEREGDLLAQWSTNRVGERRLQEMAEEHGPRELARRASELMDWTERLTRELLAGLPDGTSEFEDELEEELEGPDDGEPRNARLRVTIEKRGRRVTFDFTESDAAPTSPLNATRAVTVSAVFYALRALLPPHTPSNDGILRPVTIRTRPGTLVDAAYPSGVAAGNVETSQRLVDVLLGALAPLLPERVPAASAGTMSNLTFGGTRLRGGEREAYAYYETIAGGAGAGPEAPGAHAVQTHMTNTRNTPIEELETSHPVRVLACGVRRGSGGAGRHAGGDGAEKRLLFLAPAQVSWVAERQERGPWGLAGGEAGRPGGARLFPPASARPAGDPGAPVGGTGGPAAGSPAPGSGRGRRLPGRITLRVPPGAVLELRTPGGGGFGPPGGCPG